MTTRRNSDEDDSTSRRDNDGDDDKDKQRDESVINDDDDDAKVDHDDDDVVEESSGGGGSAFWTAAKFAISGCLLWSALFGGGKRNNHNDVVSVVEDEAELLGGGSSAHRRLQSVDSSSSLPSYMGPVMKDLEERKKLFADTPPEEVKYWFEYTGPLQKYFYRFSKSRGKADYFEGRDDSGVVSARYIPDAGGNEEFRTMFSGKNGKDDDHAQQYARLWENCLAMGSPSRPDTSKGTVWNDWFGGGGKSGSKGGDNLDRCRVLFAINTVGAGRGTTMLWETHPPAVHAEGPRPWMSEQETAAVHLERNLQEINAMCASGLVAARVQILVCEPIPDLWTEWMDSVLVDCGGKPWPLHRKTSDASNVHVEDRPSPVQIVVMASAATADRCHDLKSGFMEQRQQDLLLAPPYLSASTSTSTGHGKLQQQQDPTVKLTSRDLISSDHHDVYVAMRWSSLVTIRAVNSFLQASADMAAAASSPVNQQAAPEEDQDDQHEHVPSSPFLIPSFVRVSYVSEENSKVAKWRMHGDFFHPAAWEICKDSFDVTWIPHSLAGPRMRNVCAPSPPKKLAAGTTPRDCGQWWVFFTELQMPTSPEVYANEITPAVVQGGSNFFWMLTERQRQEIVKSMVCRHDKQQDHCPVQPQAVIPLGDLESFLINYTPNTALGKHHVQGRRPGYSHEEERKRDRERVRERKQLHGQEDIEKALFDYTIYPAALFRKDATIKAARQRDRVLTKKKKGNGKDAEEAAALAVGPQTIKSSYYDVTITKPRLPVPGWCQAIARKGLCALYGDYFRLNDQDDRCAEACGLRRDWSPIKY